MKCKAITRAGLPCPAAAGANGLCYFHANPQRAQKLGQMGGWKNRRRPAVELQIPYNLSASDLGRVVVESMRLVVSGDLEPRAAAAIVQLGRLRLQILQGIEMDARLSTLENQVAGEQAQALTSLKALTENPSKQKAPQAIQANENESTASCSTQQANHSHTPDGKPTDRAGEKNEAGMKLLTQDK